MSWRLVRESIILEECPKTMGVKVAQSLFPAYDSAT